MLFLSINFSYAHLNSFCDIDYVMNLVSFSILQDPVIIFYKIELSKTLEFRPT